MSILINNEIEFTVGKKVVEYRKIRGIVDEINISSFGADGPVGEYN